MNQRTTTRSFNWIRRTTAVYLAFLLIFVTSIRCDSALAQLSRDQDAAAAALSEIETLKQQFLNTPYSSNERAKRLDNLLNARRKLLSDYPDDLRNPVWQGDLAFDLLFLAASENGLNLEIEFGLPTASDLHRYRAIADEAYELADEASAGVSDTILEIEESDDFHNSPSLQQRRRHLVQFESRRRIPFLIASAQYAKVIADSSDPLPTIPLEGTRHRGESPSLADDSDQTKADATTLDRLLEILDLADDLDLLLDEPWRTKMRLVAGFSAIHLGDFERGRRLITMVESNPQNGDPTRFRAFMAERLMNVSTKAQAPDPASRAWNTFAASDPKWIERNAFWLLLRCDFEFRRRCDQLNYWQTHRQQPTASGKPVEALFLASNKRRFDWLLGAYQSFMTSEAITLSKAAREQAVGEHIARTVPSDLPIAELPPIVVLAQAGKQIADAEMRSAAMKTLQQLADKPADEVADWVRPRALYLLATAHLMNGDRVTAAQAYYELARDFPDSEPAGDALSQALSLSSIKQADADKMNRKAQRDLFEAAGALAMKEFRSLPHFDQWMVRRGVFEFNLGRFDDAMAALDIVSKESPEYPYALSEIARMRYKQGDQIPKSSDGERTGDDSASEFFRKAITFGERSIDLLRAASAQSSDSQFKKRASRTIDSISILTADAYLRLNEPETALAIVDPILEMKNSTPDDEENSRADFLRVRVDALTAMNREDEARRELKKLQTDAPKRAVPVINRMASLLYLDLRNRERADHANDSYIRKRADERLVPLAKMAVEAASKVRPNSDPPTDEDVAIQFRYADSLRLAGQFDKALPILVRLKKYRPDRAEILVSFAECAFQLGDDAESIAVFSRISNAFKQDRNEMFWLAELRSLEILDRSDKHTKRIFPRIQRLKLYDPLLGGNRFLGEFRQLENKYAP